MTRSANTMNDFTPVTAERHAALMAEIEAEMTVEQADHQARLETAAAELTADAMSRLGAAFGSYRDEAGNLTPHCPSAEMYAALQDAQHQMSRMAARIAAQEFTLSSLDPGVGKTQALVHWLKGSAGQREPPAAALRPEKAIVEVPEAAVVPSKGALLSTNRAGLRRRR
jgi:hypothetical protein